MTFTIEELDIITASLPCYEDKLIEDLEQTKRTYEYYKETNNVESIKLIQPYIKSQEEELHKVYELHDKLVDISAVDLKLGKIDLQI